MNEDLTRLLMGEPIEPEAEDTVFEELTARSEPDLLLQVSRHLLRDRRRLQRALAETKLVAKQAKAQGEQAQRQLTKMLKPPLVPATVLRVCAERRLDVHAQGGRRIVGVHEDLDASALRAGDEVWIDAETAIAVARAEDGPRVGRVVTVAERMQGRLLVRGEGNEDRTVLCDDALSGQIAAGDRVLVSSEVPCVLEHLPRQPQSSHLLQERPRDRFEDIGGLDDLIFELRQELSLHLFHQELVQSYDLPLMRGMTLVGPPGVGKTMVARAVAGFLADEAPETHFMNVPPGSWRGSYYGQTEERIRELFAVARAAPGLVVMFFDELDTFGARGASPGHEIDDRVMGTFLEAIDGLDASEGVFVIGATNRLELIDPAILRQGRFGDRIVQVPRPNRAGARAILSNLLHDGLPWADGVVAEAAVSAAVSFLYAPEGAAGSVVQLTFADGSRQDVRARDVISGALLAGSVRDAKKVAAMRQLEQGAALCETDVVDALARALDAEARKLKAVSVARRALSLPRAEEITGVELPTERSVGAHSRLRAA